MTETGLDYIVYIQPTQADIPDTLDIQAMSGKLTVEDANLWRSLVSLTPLNGDTPSTQEMVGLFKGLSDDFILARTRTVPDAEIKSVHQYISVPRMVLQAMTGNLRLLLELTERPLNNLDAQTNGKGKLPSIEIPQSPTWTSKRRHQLLEWLLKSYAMPALLYMLDCALSPQRLTIQHAPPVLSQRLDLVEGLMILLPASTRPDLTFTTNTPTPKISKARIAFAETSEASNRHTVDVTTLDDDGYTFTSPYVQMLANAWHDDINTFMVDLRAIDLIPGQMLANLPLLEGLNTVAARHQLNQDIIAEVDVPIEIIIDALAGDYPPLGEIQTQYIQRVLTHALDEREPDAVGLIATYMAQNQTVETFVHNELRKLIDGSPDDVYFFARLRLNEGMDENLLPILHEAAEQALEVALSDGESKTLMTWLNLIAREPADYQLMDVLKQGIATAQERAHDNPQMGANLILFAAKRMPDHIDHLLADEQLFNTMGDPVGPALRDYDPEAVDATLELGREIALILLSRAAQVAENTPAAAAVFDPEAVDYLWAYYIKGKFGNLPVTYQPDYVLNMVIEAADDWLPEAAIDVLLKRIVAEGGLDLLLQLAGQIAETHDLITLLVTNFQVNATATEDTVTIVRQLQEQNIITQQQAVDLYLQLAANRDWSDSTRTLVERVARMIQQDQTLDVSLDALWQMLRISSGENKMDAVANVVTRRTLKYIEAVQDEGELLEMLTRLHQRLTWSKSLRVYLLSWWRDFIQGQPLARIQQLSRILEGKKGFGEERAVLETTIAVRRMLGQRDLAAFAEDLATTYNLLQAISESFDPNSRSITHFDQLTVRSEIEAQGDEISGDERQVLAKNLKELAQLIVNMSDHRSKPAIMRREEDIERQLITGDQRPQSGIDTMRWLSGYLNGSQPDKPDGDDE